MKPAPKPPSEAETQARIQLAIGARPDCRVFRMNVGLAKDPRTGQTIRFGTPGMADLLCILGTGQFLWLEVKSQTGRLRPDQQAFQRMVHELAGPAHYVVARSVDDATAAVEALLQAPQRIPC